jgi:hypothetical protein
MNTILLAVFGVLLVLYFMKRRGRLADAEE